MSRAPEGAESSAPAWEARDVRQKRRQERTGTAGPNSKSAKTLRRRMHVVLEAGRSSGRLGLAFEIFLIALILANAVAVSLDSVPQYAAAYGRALLYFEYVSVAIFTLEYALRVWTAPEDPRFAAHPFGDRLRYMMQPYMLIDFLAIAPA